MAPHETGPRGRAGEATVRTDPAGTEQHARHAAQPVVVHVTPRRRRAREANAATSPSCAAPMRGTHTRSTASELRLNSKGLVASRDLRAMDSRSVCGTLEWNNKQQLCDNV